MKKWYRYLVLISVVLLPLLAMIPLPVSYFIPIRFADMPVHMVAYGALSGLITLAMYSANKSYAPWKLFLFPGLIASLVGVVGETLQLFVPTRNFGYIDMAVNVIGAVGMQVFICFFWLGIHRKRLKLSKQGIERRKLREQGVRHAFVPLQDKQGFQGAGAAAVAEAMESDGTQEHAAPVGPASSRPAQTAATPDRAPRSPREAHQAQAKTQSNSQMPRKRHKFEPRTRHPRAKRKSS